MVNLFLYMVKEKILIEDIPITLYRKNIKNAYLFGNYQNAYGYKKAILDEGKLIYVYNEDNLDQITLYRE